jgi:septum formation protein
MVPTLVLASNSPRRRQLLSLTGWTFIVQPVDIDEHPLSGELPEAYVLRLAESKACAALQFAQPGQTLLTADTTVADGRIILGKPDSSGEAWSMLRSLRGRMHTVFTAISVCRKGTVDAHHASSGKGVADHGLFKDICATQVLMRDYSDEEIESYIASGDPFDKAGAYAVQNPYFRPVERIEGCYCCVVGLPVCRVVQALARYSLTPPEDITAACQTRLEMNAPCPVYEALLRIEGETSHPMGKVK